MIEKLNLRHVLESLVSPSGSFDARSRLRDYFQPVLPRRTLHAVGDAGYGQGIAPMGKLEQPHDLGTPAALRLLYAALV